MVGITLTKGRTSSTTYTGSLATSESLFIESASISLSIAFQKQITNTVAYSFSWTVPKSWKVGTCMRVPTA